MRILIRYITLIVLLELFLLPTLSIANELFKYTDSNGVTYFVTNRAEIPPEYQNQVQAPVILPKISKSGKFFEADSAPNVATRREAKKETPQILRSSASRKVEIFVTSWCKYCKQLEEFLKQNRIHYTRYDIEADAKGRKLYDQLGGGGFPITRIGARVIYGYDPAGVLSALKK